MENRKKRNSILKVRQPTDLINETVENGGTVNRRVSFHNVKHVQQYDRDHGKMVDATPIKEKISDTLGSDGILTPRGGNMDNTNILEEDPTAVYGGADMSLESTFGRENDDTRHLFNVTRDKTIVYERTTIKVTEILRGEADDTNAMFNQTNMDESNMSMDQSTFLVPQLPSQVKDNKNMTVNKTIPMELEEEEEQKTFTANDTANLFNITNSEAVEMDVSQMPSRTNDDTMALFRSPAPLKKMTSILEKDNVELMDMEMSRQDTPEIGSEMMDISAAPPQNNSTMALFESRNENDMDITEKVSSPEVENSVSRPLREDMDISRLSNAKPNDTYALFQSPTSSESAPAPIHSVLHQVHEDMDMSVAPNSNDTMAMFQSPAPGKATPAGKKRVLHQIHDDMDISTSTINPNDTLQSPASGKTIPPSEKNDISQQDQSHVTVTEEQMKSPDNSQKTLAFEQSLDLGDESTIHPENGTLPIEEKETTIKSTSHVQETLQNFHVDSSENVTVQKEENIMFSEMEERTIGFENQSNSRMSITNHTITLNKSIMSNTMNQSVGSVPKRRKSLLRDTLIRESPRRMAHENSMLSMHTPNEGTALSEYRQNKSILNSSVQLNDTANMSSGSVGGRDIFALNTSVRSPHHHNISINRNTPRQPSPMAMDDTPTPPSPGFQMPVFDQAVVNVIYLTPEDDQPIPEAVEFETLISNETSKLQKDIQQQMENTENIHAEKIENLKNDVISKLSKDEWEAVLVAREEAELRFLELRLQFGIDQRKRQEDIIQKLESENGEVADKIRDAQNLQQVKKELEDMKNHPTMTECREIRKQYMESKKAYFEMQMRAFKNTYDIAVKLADEREEARRQFEERNEKMAQLEDENKKKMNAFGKKLKELVHQLE